jgi:hypothetical protein
LPVRPTLIEGESLESYVRRTAARNHRPINYLLGRRCSKRLWDAPEPEVLARISTLTGQPVARLERATLAGCYPGMGQRSYFVSRRSPFVSPWCPQCGPTYDVERRLPLLVACTRCDRLLTDTQGHVEKAVDPHLAAEQVEVRRLLASTTPEGRARVQRLRRLMQALAPVLTPRWPPLAPGEPPERRAVAVQTEHLARRVPKTERPPASIAVLLRLCWAPSRTPAGTHRMLEQIRLHPASLGPLLEDLPAHPASDTHVALGGLRPENVPQAYTHDLEGLLPPTHEVHFRRALSTLLVYRLQSRDHGTAATFAAAAQLLGRRVGRRLDINIRLSRVLADQPEAPALLQRFADELLAEPLADYQRRRLELRHKHDVPTSVGRQLPAAARSHPEASKHAAVWIWLDATRGVLAGGPHPKLNRTSMLAFHDALGPDGRLVLREHWMQQIDETNAMLDHTPATATAAVSQALAKGA